MPQAKPAGLDEAMKPFKALVHAWGLQQVNPSGGGIADSSPLRNALPMPAGPTVGDVRALVRVIESFYGEIPL